MAFELGTRVGLQHKFNEKLKKVGYDWLLLFLKRHPELSIRKSEGVSINGIQGMHRSAVMQYFTLLDQVLVKYDLFNKPANIYNVDESGLQLNNKAGYVMAKKGSKSVAAAVSGEKGETISIIACCNAEGNFLPSACIFKGKNKKPEFEEGMPPGSSVYMSEKSAYVNTSIFFNWIKNHFVPKKSRWNNSSYCRRSHISQQFNRNVGVHRREKYCSSMST